MITGLHAVSLIVQVCIVAVFSSLVWLVPNGIKQQSFPTDEPHVKPAADALRDEELNAIRAFVNGSSPKPDAFTYFRDKLSKAIDYAIRRHDWYEDQRSRVFQQITSAAFWILAISVTIAGIVMRPGATAAPTFDTFGLFLSLLSSALGALVSLFRAVYLYNVELDASRPYRMISDIRFWYFRYNMPDHSASDRSTTSLQHLGESEIRQRERFFRRIEDNLDVSKSIREDIEQIYILQALQRYKSDSLRLLRWLLGYLFMFFAVEVFWTLISFAYFAS